MQNSMWKLATLLGVIGVGCLVIIQVQKNLGPRNVQASTEVPPAGEAVPAVPAGQDPFTGFEDFGSSAGASAASFDSYEPPAGNDISQASYEPAAQREPFGSGSGSVGGFGADDEIPFGDETVNFNEQPPTGSGRSATEDFFSNTFDGAAEAVSDAGTAAKRSLADTASQAGDFLGSAVEKVGEKVNELTEPAGQPGLFDPNPQPPLNGRTAAVQEVQPLDAAFGDDPGFEDTQDPMAGAFDSAAQAPPFESQPLGNENNFETSPIEQPGDDQSGFEQESGFGGVQDVGDQSGFLQDPPAAGRARVDLNAAPEGPALPSSDQFRDGFGAQDNTPPPADTRDDYPETQYPGTSSYDSRVQAIPATGTRIQSTGSTTKASEGIRATGARYQKSYENVPHGTLRPQLRIEKSAPGSASIGKELVYKIRIRNVGNAVANEVIVEDQIPRGSRLLGTIPQAELVENILIWRFAALEPNAEKTIKIKVVPEREGQIGSVATVNFKAEIGARTTVTAPRLRLELQGQPEARVGETITFRYRVTNVGSGDASNVMIRNPLPTQLQHPAGDNIEYPLGDLAAGKSQDVTLQLIAAGPGDIRNSAVVVADGGIQSPGEARLNILGEQLQVTRRGPARRFLGRRGEYENVVRNVTHRDALNATLVEYVPLGMKLDRADSGGQWNEAKRTITWSIPRVRAGESLSFKAVLVPERAGNHESVVQVVEQAGFKSNAKLTTQVVHLDNMGLQLSELDGPVAVGERVVFTINVKNRGTSTVTRTVLRLEVPRELGQAQEAGPLGAQQKGNFVEFEPIQQLVPGAQKRFQVSFTAQSAANDVRLRAFIQSDQMRERLNTEESITIYDDDRP